MSGAGTSAQRVIFLAYGIRLTLAVDLRIARGPDGSAWLAVLDAPGGGWWGRWHDL